MTAIALFALLCSCVVAGLTGWLRARALRAGLLDLPNARSSHSVPTPRGGGLAIVGAVVALLAGLAFARRLDPQLVVAILPPFVVVAWVGWADDRRGLSPLLRLVVHLAASAWCLVWMYDPARWGAPGDPAWLAFALWPLLLWLGIGWAINLFNFMDGIDGIAGAQGMFIAALGGLLLELQGDSGPALAMLLIAASCSGFLPWNWAPARIFMGDVGSGALGFLLAAVPVATIERGPAQLWPWVILWGAFLADSTVTLLRRLARGARPYEAHRTHAYQVLSRRWRSHGRVSLGFAAVNLFWLAPLAVFASLWPAWAVAVAAIAIVPLFVWVFHCGAGRPESTGE